MHAPAFRRAPTALLALALATAGTGPALAAGSSADASAPSDASSIASEWADITYKLPEKERADALKALDERADAAVAARPDDADLLTWSGIVSASYAGAKGGLGALGAAKRARRELEAAMAIDPDALDGGARSSLGTLYDKVPGWPVGFGDDDEAETLLSESATLHPDDVNAQYFWADYLASHDRADEARTVFERAATIPVRPDSRTADEGRQGEIREALQGLGGGSAG